MQARELLPGPGADIVLPALLRGEQRQTGKVLGRDAFFLRERQPGREDRAEIVRFREADTVMLPLVRRLKDDRKVQQPLVQLFRHLLRVAAGDVVAKIRIQLLECPDLPRQITDLTGLRKTEVYIAARDVVQR